MWGPYRTVSLANLSLPHPPPFKNRFFAFFFIPMPPTESRNFADAVGSFLSELRRRFVHSNGVCMILFARRTRRTLCADKTIVYHSVLTIIIIIIMRKMINDRRSDIVNWSRIPTRTSIFTARARIILMFYRKFKTKTRNRLKSCTNTRENERISTVQLWRHTKCRRIKLNCKFSRRERFFTVNYLLLWRKEQFYIYPRAGVRLSAKKKIHKIYSTCVIKIVFCLKRFTSMKLRIRFKFWHP